MLKNKKTLGLLTIVCVMFFCIVFLTLSGSKDKQNNLQESQIANIDKNDSENKETKVEEESKTVQSKSDQKTEVKKDDANNQTLPEKDKNLTDKSTPPKKPSQTDQSDLPQQIDEYVYISIDCKTILNNMNDIPQQYKNYVPKDGMIYLSKKVKINEGDTVFDITTKVAKMNKIQLSQSAGYIQSIHNLPEKLFQGSGGWMFKVNGIYANKGSKEYKLKSGDKLEWRYSCYIGDVY